MGSGKSMIQGIDCYNVKQMSPMEDDRKELIWTYIPTVPHSYIDTSSVLHKVFNLICFFEDVDGLMTAKIGIGDYSEFVKIPIREKNIIKGDALSVNQSYIDEIKKKRENV